MGSRRPSRCRRALVAAYLAISGSHIIHVGIALCDCAIAASLAPLSSLAGRGIAPDGRGFAAHVRRRSVPRPSRSGGARGRRQRRCAVPDAVPASPAQLLAERRARRWDSFRSSLDWTRYHLDVVFIEDGGTRESRKAAGIFERVARYHGCAGALPGVLGTTGSAVPALEPEEVDGLGIGPQWLDTEVEVYDAPSLKHYDVVVCVDGRAADFFRAALAEVGEDPYLPNMVELSDFGAYLELRKPESPMKAWVPDWRAVIDPDYDERTASSSAPLDDALAVWKELPEDLAQLIQPQYESISSYVEGAADAAGGKRQVYRDALLAFHVGGLVRFLMDTYPLDLRGGPGYCGPP